MSSTDDPLDYVFEDKGLATLAHVLRGARGKYVRHDKVEEAQQIITKTQKTLETLREDRSIYAKEIQALEQRQKALDDDESDFENPVEEEESVYWIVGILTFLVAFFILRGALGWWGIVAIIPALMAGFLSVPIAASLYVRPKYEAAKEQALQAMREKRKARRKAEYTETDTLTGVRFDNEATKIEVALSRIKEALEDGVFRYVREKKKAVSELIELSVLDVSITVDEFDPDTRGAPVITWDGPNMTMTHIDSSNLSAENFAKEGYGRLAAIVASEEIAVTLTIYVNEGRLIEENFDEHCEVVYTDSLSSNGVFTHVDAPVGKTLNYYVVTKISYLSYQTNTAKLTPYHSLQEIVNDSKRLIVKTFKSNAEALEEEIQEHTTNIKRERFHEKIGKGNPDTDANPADRKKELVARKLAEYRHRQEVEKNAAELRETLKAEGLPEEEIEEAVEEFLQSM